MFLTYSTTLRTLDLILRFSEKKTNSSNYILRNHVIAERKNICYDISDTYKLRFLSYCEGHIFNVAIRLLEPLISYFDSRGKNELKQQKWIDLRCVEVMIYPLRETYSDGFACSNWNDSFLHTTGHKDKTINFIGDIKYTVYIYISCFHFCFLSVRTS